MAIDNFYRQICFVSITAGSSGECQYECRPFGCRCALQGDAASRKAHDLAGDGKSDAAAAFFGGEERDENMFGFFRRNCGSVVADFDQDSFFFVAIGFYFDQAVSLFAAATQLKGTDIKLGAQNVHFEDKGAFTGECNIASLKELGVEYVILGHSERRQYFAETDETVNKKVLKVLAEGLKPIVCVGESLQQKQTNITNEVVCMQTKAALCGVSPAKVTDVVIAYEPIWAIGTGMTATATDAIRAAIRELFGDAADQVRILYGGSMNDKNATELMSQPEIDGGLIGGASLVAEKFEKVINYHG